MENGVLRNFGCEAAENATLRELEPRLRYSLLMGFLPVVYVGLYLVVAGVGYLFCGGLSRWCDKAITVFIAILVFGACSYVGFFVVVLAVGVLPLKGLLEGPTQHIVYLSAYIFPGIVGAWLSIKALKSMKPNRRDVPENGVCGRFDCSFR